MVAYFISIAIQGLVMYSGGVRPRGPDFRALQVVPAENLEPILFIMLSIGSVVVIYNAFSSGTLIFSIAHIDFLFPTPIGRKKVLLVQLLRDYIKYGFYVTFLFFVVGGPVYGSLGVRMLPWGFVSIAGLMALLLMVVNISHTVNIVFTFGYERFKQAGFIIKAVLFIGPISAFAYGVFQYVSTGSSYASVLWAVNSPVVNFVFAPARWCATLLLAPLYDLVSDDWRHLAYLCVFAAASFALLMSRKENIYEPSLGISAAMARRRQAMRQGDLTGVRMDALRAKGTKRVSGLGIPPFGAGASALLWKSLLLRYRVSRGQLGIMLLAPVIIVFIIRQSTVGRVEYVLPYLPAVLLYVVWILSMMAPTELRAELKQANIVKSMPIAAWKVMLAQAVNSVIYLSAGVLVFSAAMWAIIPETRGQVLHGWGSLSGVCKRLDDEHLGTALPGHSRPRAKLPQWCACISACFYRGRADGCRGRDMPLSFQDLLLDLRTVRFDREHRRRRGWHHPLRPHFPQVRSDGGLGSPIRKYAAILRSESDEQSQRNGFIFVRHLRLLHYLVIFHCVQDEMSGHSVDWARVELGPVSVIHKKTAPGPSRIGGKKRGWEGLLFSIRFGRCDCSTFSHL
jgi:hypothetical protein